MILPTWWSVFGSGISFLQRSREDRTQEQLQLVEEELNEAIIQLVEMKDEMNLSTTQKSDDRGLMKDYLRLSKATMQEQQQLVEMKLREAARMHQLVEMEKRDWWKLSTTRCSVHGKGMSFFLRSREDRMQELVEMKSREARMQKQLQLVEKKLREAVRMHKLVEMEKSDWWKLSTTQKSDDGGWMKDYLRSRKARMQQLLQLVEMKLREAVRMHKLVEMEKRDWWKLSTTQKSDDGGWMKDYLRSREARMQKQLQLVEEELNEAVIQLAEMKKSDRMNLSTTQKSDDGGWMKDYLRSRKARMQKQLQLVEMKLNEAIIQLVEMKKSDSMNLSTTQKSDDGGWMSSFLRSREDRMQELVEMKLREAVRMHKLVEMEKSDWMNLSTTQKSDDGGWMKDYLRSREARMQEQLQLVEKTLRKAIIQQQLQLVEKKLREAVRLHQLVEKKKSDRMNLSTTQKSDDGGWMKDYLRSRKARMQQLLQLVEMKLNEAIIQLVEMKKSDRMNLSTTQKSDDGGWMKDYLRSRKARMQEQLQLAGEELNEAIIQLVEMKKSDWMNLSTTQKSDDGGWMKDYLSSGEDIMQEQLQLVEKKKSDWWKLSTTQKSDDGGWMKDYLSPELQRPDRSKVKAPRERNRSSLESVRIKHQSMEGIVTFQGEPSSPWDVMNLPTALQAVVGGGM